MKRKDIFHMYTMAADAIISGDKALQDGRFVNALHQYISASGILDRVIRLAPEYRNDPHMEEICICSQNFRGYLSKKIKELQDGLIEYGAIA